LQVAFTFVGGAAALVLVAAVVVALELVDGLAVAVVVPEGLDCAVVWALEV
jgi:hypothetical protein